MKTPSNFTEDFVSERLERALASAGRLEVVDADAMFEGFEGDLTRLAEARVVQSSHLVRGRVRIRVIDDGRCGEAWTTDLSDDGLLDAAKTAKSLAKNAPHTGFRETLPKPGNTVVIDPDRAIHAPTAALTSADKGQWLAQALSDHRNRGLALAGRFHTGLHTLAVRSTQHLATFHQGSRCELALSSLENPAGHEASSYRARFSYRIDADTVAEMAEETRQECALAANPVEVETGAWDVILTPAAMADLVGWLCYIGFSSQFIEDGRSFAAGNMGQQLTGEAFSLHDDGMLPDSDGVPLPFDVEGTPKQRTSLIHKGALAGVVHNSRSAQKQGCSSTGHASADPMWPTLSSAAAHPVVSAGTADSPSLIAQVERGLLVTRLHYVNGLLEPRRAVMTGLLRDAAFEIRDGKLLRSVRPMRFTDSILEAFGRIEGPHAISAVRQPQKMMFHDSHCGLMPHVLVRGLKFTSGR